MSQHEGEASRPEDQLVERPKLSVLAELDAKGSWKQFDSAVLAFAGILVFIWPLFSAISPFQEVVNSAPADEERPDGLFASE